jgi:hypothetical protein
MIDKYVVGFSCGVFQIAFPVCLGREGKTIKHCRCTIRRAKCR